jgi:hypothetical protein
MLVLSMTAIVEAQSIDVYVAGFVTNKDGSIPGDKEIKYQGFLTNEPTDTTVTALCSETGGWSINLNAFDKLGEADKIWTIGDTLVVVFTKLATSERNVFVYVTKDPNVEGNPQFPAAAAALPVEMVSFVASARDQGWGYQVVLDWKTATESNNLGFEVQRSQDGISFEKVGFISGAGSTTASQAYTFVDKNVETGKYYYRLKQLDSDGSSKTTDVLEVTLAAPERYELSQNYPNPFNPATEILFKVKEQGRVQLMVFDIVGRQVATLVDGTLSAGIHKVSFNGRALPSGMYLYVMKAGNYHEVKKMALVK